MLELEFEGEANIGTALLVAVGEQTHISIGFGVPSQSEGGLTGDFEFDGRTLVAYVEGQIDESEIRAYQEGEELIVEIVDVVSTDVEGACEDSRGYRARAFLLDDL